MPDSFYPGKPVSSKWIGSVLAVVEATQCSTTELINLRNYFELVTRHGSNDQAALTIAQNVDTVLAKLELNVPGDMQGAFIPAGGQHDGYQAVAKAIALAKKTVSLVDPYGDNQIISDFVSLVPEGMPVFVMSDEKYAFPNLKPAALKWIAQ